MASHRTRHPVTVRDAPNERREAGEYPSVLLPEESHAGCPTLLNQIRLAWRALCGWIVAGFVRFPPETAAPDVNITPVTQAPRDPEAGSSQDDVETEGTFVLDEDGIETTITMHAVGGIVTEQTTT